MAQIPIAEGLFTWPSDEPRLIGGRCEGCGTAMFPRSVGCPRCSKPDPVEMLLPRRGRLWTWTTQEFRPKAPFVDAHPERDFVPYLVGYVELGGEVHVEGRLTHVAPEDVDIGMEMQVVAEPYRTDGEGNEIMTYAFAPVT